MNKVKEIAFHPASILTMVGTLLSGGGLGVYKSIPYMKGMANRMDVVIYLLCENDSKCVEDAWEKVTASKRAMDARHGDH